ncbi:MAG: Ig-like domain-containing protein [Armatimonadota bacterium]
MWCRVCVFAFLILGLLSFLAGCGGGSTPAPAGFGNIAVTVDWPERTRAIPYAANSLAFTVRDAGGNTLAAATLNRPETSLLFTNLPSAKVTLAATAHPQLDGGGTSQASGGKTVTVQADQTVSVTFTTADSTVTSLQIVPNPVTLQQGQTVGLVAIAQDEAARAVLVTPATLSWSSDNSGIASIAAQTGATTGVSPGTTTVRVRETESGISTTVAVTTLAHDPSLFANDKVLRVLYIVPSDCTFSEEYNQWIEYSVFDLQRWYYQMTGGYTFKLRNPVVETVQTPHTAQWYTTNLVPNAEEWTWFFYNTLNDAQEYHGVQYADGKNIWLVYVDGVGPMGAAAAPWFAAIPENDTRFPFWIGVVGHELTHAFGLPHAESYEHALTYLGCYRYPNAHLVPYDLSVLRNHAFFTTNVNGADMAYPDLTRERYCYTENYDRGGYYIHRSGNDWEERKAYSGETHPFFEIGRDQESITLYDTLRDQYVKLPIGGGISSISYNTDTAWQYSYNVWHATNSLVTTSPAAPSTGRFMPPRPKHPVPHREFWDM